MHYVYESPSKYCINVVTCTYEVMTPEMKLNNSEMKNIEKLRVRAEAPLLFINEQI